MNVKKIGLAALAIVALLVAGMVSIQDGSAGGGNHAAVVPISRVEEGVSVRAPDFKLDRADGGVVSLSDYAGKIIILNFWATWCIPCRQEIPGFIKLQEKYKDDLVILGISMDQNGPDVVPQFMDRFGINYPILYGSAKVANDYGGITGIPTTFVIDRNLIIRKMYVGYRPEYVFERDIKEII